MGERIAELEARVEALARELAELRPRVATLEARREAAGADDGPGASRPLPVGSLAEAPIAASAGSVVAWAGRTLVTLGGASLLRALTDADAVPKSVGVAAGLAYAAFWMLRCHLDAAVGRRTSAAFHGVTSVTIAFPILWEASARLGVLAPPAAAGLILASFAAGSLTAWRHELAAVAGSAALAALVTSMVLLVHTGDLVSFAVTFFALAASIEALAFRDRWPVLRWPAALGFDVAALALAEVVSRPQGPAEGYAVVPLPAALALELSLPLLYLASTAARTLLQRRTLTPFDGLQTVAALSLGLGGAARVLGAAGASAVGLGLLTLVLGSAGYLAAFAVLEPRGRHDAAFRFHATLGFVLVLLGSWILLTVQPLALVFSALGLVAARFSRGFCPGNGAAGGRAALAAHGVGFAGAAAAVSGLLGAALDALLAPPTASWREATPAGLATALGALACYAVLAVGARLQEDWWQTTLRAALAALTGVCLAGIGTSALLAAVGGGPGPGADVAEVATVRTAVLAALSLALASARGRWGRDELGWLVYPLLLGGGFKLLLEDLPSGRPATLALALALYGVALITTPRLLRRSPAHGVHSTPGSPPSSGPGRPE